MENVLVSIGNVESNLSLVENLVQNIFVYELPEGNLIMNMRFSLSQDVKSEIIGGLTATIHEFAGEQPNDTTRSIKMDHLNLIFHTRKKFLIVFACDPNYPDEQFEDAILSFADSFEECLKIQNYGTSVDGAAISLQTIKTLLSEEIHMDIQLGSKVTIYPFKLRELADETASELLGVDKTEESPDLYDDTDTQEEIKSEYAPVKNQSDALNQLLSQFLSSFKQASEITLIRTAKDGNLLKFSKTRLDQEISERVHNIVMEMIDTVSVLLDSPIEERVIDLDNRILIFQNVSDYSFLYVVFEGDNDVDMLEPTVERIASSIDDLFPDEIEI